MSDDFAPDLSQSRATPALSRGWKWVLALSLGLNLAIVGVVGGLAFAMRDVGGDAPPERRAAIGALRSLGPLAHALEREEKRALLDRMAQSRRQGAPITPELARAHEDLIAALRADPFDPARATRALADQRAALGAVQARGHESLIAVIAAMPPARRQEIAAALARR